MQTHPELNPEQLASMLVLPMILLAGAALVVAQALSALARLKVGPEIAAQRPGTLARRLVLTVAITGLLAWIVARGEVWPVPPFLCLGAALLVVWTAPGAHDAVLGEGGVQRGWHARRFEALEEWRLTGEHLRFRLFGEWTSVPCPPERQAAVRAKLVAAAPERESPFQD
jgi:hypothetical protein